jgi:hypothetical protein
MTAATNRGWDMSKLDELVVMAGLKRDPCPFGRHRRHTEPKNQARQRKQDRDQ